MYNTTDSSNTTAEATISSPPSPKLTERNVRLCFYVVTFVIGLIGNILVVVILSKKSKRTIHQMFILNLAISDLTFLAFTLPVSTYELFEPITREEYYCRFIYPMQTITYFISIFSITSMAVHRCYVIVNPYKPKMKDRSGHAWIALIWCLSLIIVLPLAVVTTENSGECDEKWPSFNHRRAYTAALFVLQFLLPVFVIAIAYIWIGVYLVKNKGPQTTVGNQKHSANQEKKRRENKQIITTLATIVILFTICMLPGQIAWMIMDFGTPQEKEVYLMLLKFSDILDFIHACVNPIVYGLLTDTFRKDYKKAFSAFAKIICCVKTTIAPDSKRKVFMTVSSPHLRPTVGQSEALSYAETPRSSPHTIGSSSLPSNEQRETNEAQQAV